MAWLTPTMTAYTMSVQSSCSRKRRWKYVDQETAAYLPPSSQSRNRTAVSPRQWTTEKESAPMACAAIARTRCPLSNAKRRAVQTIPGIMSAGRYHSARLSTRSFPASMLIPGLLVMSVSRYACRSEKKASAVATPNTQGQGGVHALRMRAVSEADEKPVKTAFSGPSKLRFITFLWVFSPGLKPAP